MIDNQLNIEPDFKQSGFFYSTKWLFDNFAIYLGN